MGSSRLLAYHRAKQLLTYLPTPVFFAGLIYSLISDDLVICGSSSWEMPMMWFLMALAHSKPWVVYFEIQGCPHCRSGHSSDQR